MKEATGAAVLKAWKRTAKRIAADDTLTAACESAGFIIQTGQKKGEREGFQVFVTIYRYSDRVMARSPLSGGLLAREQEIGEGK